MLLPQVKISIVSFLNGKRVDGFDLRESHTWVRNAYNVTAYTLLDLTPSGVAFGDGYINCKVPDGTIKTTLGGWAWVGGAGTANGIVVGTGSTAWTFEDYKLETLIAHGNGAGQLSYVVTETITDAFVGDVVTTTGQRYFNNNSGGTIGINEVGLYTVSSVGYGLATRDVLGATVDVPNAGQLLVTYQISGDCSP